jgi:hypothetical protein
LRAERNDVANTGADGCFVWLDKEKRTIRENISNVFKEGELDENAVVRNFRKI